MVIWFFLFSLLIWKIKLTDFHGQKNEIDISPKKTYRWPTDT